MAGEELVQQSVFPTEFQWHFRVHTEWADEYLLFLFLRFEPTYDRVAAVQGLQRFFLEQEITSYSIYEVSAPYDVMVRVWAPNGTHKHQFEEALKSGWKRPPRPIVAEALEVTEIVHQWPWQASALADVTEMKMPEETLIEKGKPLRELAQLNALQRMARRTRAGQYAYDDEDADLVAMPSARDARQMLDDYKKDKLLTSPPYDHGIRFITLVEAAEPKDPDAHEMLQTSIARILDKAQNIVEPAQGRIWDRSLYATVDNYRFVIMGRVKESEGNFHSISENLVADINSTLSAQGAHTDTSYIVLPGFLDFRDELRLPPPPPPPDEKVADAHELLRRQESATFEVKGSVFTELDGYFKRDEKLRTNKDPDNKALNSFLRATASLLNGPDGGQIVIGAVEQKAFRHSERVRQLPDYGNFKVCGIELDGYDGDWDHYARQLMEVMETRIIPSPLRWVDLRPLPIGDRMVCLVSIFLPDEWYAVRMRAESGKVEEQFFVRSGGSGGSTNRLGITEMKDHQDRTRRASRYSNSAAKP